MDSINLEKIQALRTYKQQQYVNTLLFYPLAALTFGLFCTSPFWFPTLYSSTKSFLCISIPRVLSFFLSAKSLFILGNIIVIFLVKESKFRTPNDPSYVDNNNDHAVKILAKQDKTGSKEVKTCTLLSMINKETVSKRPLEKAFEDPSSNWEIDGVGYMEEEEAEEEVLWEGEQRRENGVVEDEQEQVVGEDKREHSPVVASDDELKRRADHFIAMVNKQIKLEADDVLDCAC